MAIFPKTLRARRLNLEGLEERLNLSSYLSYGDLYVVGGNSNDTVTVNYETWYGTGYYKVTENSVNSWHTASSVTGGDVYFYGYDGNDYFDNNTGLRTTAYGHDGSDKLIGSYNNDYLSGGDGTDYLYGYGGNDTLVAGYDSSSNYLYGSSGNDALYGGYGADYMYGDADNDALYGSYGNDRLFGGNGTDALYGHDGNDWLEAGSASEYADGGDGTDWNAHVWSINGTWTTDVNQTGAGTCVVLSAMASASRTHYLEDNISYLGNYTYSVRLFNLAAGGWVYQNVHFDGSIVSNSTGSRMDPQEMTEGESWTILYQRAYLAQFYGINPLNGNQVAGFGGEPNGNQAITALTGRLAVTTSWFDYNTVVGKLSAGQTLNAGGTGHRYAIVGAWTDSAGNRFVRLYNPWGSDSTHNSMPLVADSVNDGYITMRWTDFANGVWFKNWTYSL